MKPPDSFRSGAIELIVVAQLMNRPDSPIINYETFTSINYRCETYTDKLYRGYDISVYGQLSNEVKRT